MVFRTRGLKYWVLGPSGYCAIPYYIIPYHIYIYDIPCYAIGFPIRYLDPLGDGFREAEVPVQALSDQARFRSAAEAGRRDLSPRGSAADMRGASQ